MATAEAAILSLVSEAGISDIPRVQEHSVTLQPAQGPPAANFEAIPLHSGPFEDAVPSTFLFGALHDHAIYLLRPIALRTERAHGGVTVVWDDVSEFGHGENFSDAVEDFGRTISELYKSLISS